MAKTLKKMWTNSDDVDINPELHEMAKIDSIEIQELENVPIN